MGLKIERNKSNEGAKTFPSSGSWCHTLQEWEGRKMPHVWQLLN